MGIKTGSKYYVFENGNENRVKLFREKIQAYFSKETKTNIFTETMMSIENKSANNSNLIEHLYINLSFSVNFNPKMTKEFATA